MSRLTIFLMRARRSIAHRWKTRRNEFAEYIKIVARIIERHKLQAKSWIERHNLPAEGWGAKGYEFWTFLSVLLIRTNCSRILELGSGRSTIVFAEYAKYRNVSITSIETSRKWYNKARMELRWQKLAVASIHLVKIDELTGWYSVGEFRSVVRSHELFDFVMVDGPNDTAGNSQGIRNSEVGLEEIKNCCREADVVIVDDVHRRHVLESIDRMLSNPSQYERWFYNYTVGNPYPNSLCLCVKNGSRASTEIPLVLELLGMRLYASLQRENCPED